jgi:hypothetical protein
MPRILKQDEIDTTLASPAITGGGTFEGNSMPSGRHRAPRIRELIAIFKEERWQ